MCYLTDAKEDAGEKAELLSLAKAVDISKKFKDFVSMSKMMLSHPKHKLLMTYIEQCGQTS
jgi:hypothetical protein